MPSSKTFRIKTYITSLRANLHSESSKHSLNMLMRIDPCNCWSIRCLISYVQFTLWILNSCNNVSSGTYQMRLHAPLKAWSIYFDSWRKSQTHRALFWIQLVGRYYILALTWIRISSLMLMTRKIWSNKNLRTVHCLKYTFIYISQVTIECLTPCTVMIRFFTPKRSVMLFVPHILKLCTVVFILLKKKRERNCTDWVLPT